ncbi:MAG: molybdate ABC transporter substrate-binding protein [Nitrospirales bacterium]|nr:molybdate ABC transporter substrate-binding protein [Nitrospira sp.]MDR4502438.1 molybdate ABC transporter substrate-binding protein [Nitrospirales bacterium]
MSQVRSIKNFIIGVAVYLSLLVGVGDAAEVKIAVASNFLSTMQEIASHFEQESGHATVVSSGSSGKLYAQIKHGAPFDVFFSADVQRPKLLEEEGLAVLGSRLTYAVGRLTLWSADSELVRGQGDAILSMGGFEYLAIANPKTAPYGTAAQHVLEKLGLWQKIQRRIVQGENIGQTFQFVYSGNAQLGFVALSQVLDRKIIGVGSRWDVPMELYPPLEQQAVLLVKGQHNKAAKDFFDYVKDDKAQKIIERSGYGIRERQQAER